jgi:hypothetical protein
VTRTCEHGIKKKDCIECKPKKNAAMRKALPPSTIDALEDDQPRLEVEKKEPVLCPHERIRSKCPDCPVRRCPHGKEKNKCKDCGGSAICVHARQRYKCKGILTSVTTSLCISFILVVHNRLWWSWYLYP